MSAPADTPDELELDVSGMTCATCARRVERALGKVDGVSAVSVDLVRERATVRGAGHVDLAAIADAASRAGYGVTPRAKGAPATPERSAETRRAAIALGLALGAAVPGFAVPQSQPAAIGALTVSALVTLWLGRGILRAAFFELRDRAAGMSTLVSLGALAALGSGAYQTARMGAHAHHAAGHSDAATAALLVALVLVGRALEHRAKERVAREVESLVRTRTRRARVIRHGQEAEIDARELRVGDEVRVGPHAEIPADGTLLAPEDGAAAAYFLDEAFLTGESEHVRRGVGERVRSGSVNGEAPLRMRVDAAGDETDEAKIAALVGRAQASRAPIVRIADRVASIFAPAVVLIGLSTAGVLLATGTSAPDAIARAVAVLVVACPCALGLATPTALSVALGHAARLGVLFRDAAALEGLARAKTIVFDKTGTLTEGEARVTSVRPVAPETEETLVQLAARVEAESDHPLARAIFRDAMTRALTVTPAEEVRALPGVGIEGRIDGARIVIGALDPDAGDVEPALSEEAHRARARGATLVAVRREGVLAGWLAIEDALRPEAPETVRRLEARGLEVVVLSGDHPEAVRARGEELGLGPERARGGLRPAEKEAAIAALAAPVAMVGDGANDAPALARAAVGIALGGGSAVATNAAPVTLVGSGLGRLVDAVALSRRTLSVVRQNLGLAFVYNVVALPFVAFGGLDPIGGAPVAAAAMGISSIVVVLSSLRLSR